MYDKAQGEDIMSASGSTTPTSPWQAKLLRLLRASSNGMRRSLLYQKAVAQIDGGASEVASTVIARRVSAEEIPFRAAEGFWIASRSLSSSRALRGPVGSQ
jgi:hypothetical protein